MYLILKNVSVLMRISDKINLSLITELDDF